MGIRILVVDDEKLIVKGLSFSLMQEKWEVDTAYDGEEALEKALNNEYNVILLDVMLPKLDGIEVCKKIREVSDVPIIMLTAKADDADVIMGLDTGADDYITKPFNVMEVKARINVILRRENKRGTKDNKEEILSGDIRLDISGKRAFIKDKEYNLTSKEFDVLYLLVSNPDKVYSREMLLEKVWKDHSPEDLRTVDVHVRRLREKIEEDSANPKYVYTRWGKGYYYTISK
ncbi:MAG: response regulator transcription factor [Lachnospiraceae bacterium]|jgi:DNA-binding response OmpR family regulator|nr:response regulator transcription factor [Lachnospiraceae bacterium]